MPAWIPQRCNVASAAKRNRAVAQRQDASFRFTSSQALAQAVEALTRQYDLLDLVKDADGGAGILDISTVRHSTNEELNIFTVYFTFR